MASRRRQLTRNPRLRSHATESVTKDEPACHSSRFFEVGKHALSFLS
jgi:hypothetical protein